MDYQAVTPSRTLVVTLEYGEPLSGELEAAAAEADLASAWVAGSGAVEDVELAIDDQDAFERETVTFEEPLQMPFATGTIAAGSDGPEAAISGVFARPSGQAIAGMVTDATVFGGEMIVQGFDERLSRQVDDASGMELLTP